MKILAIQPKGEFISYISNSITLPNPYRGGYLDSGHSVRDFPIGEMAEGTIDMLKDIPNVEIATSFTEAIQKIKNSQSFDVIISAFTPQQLLPKIDLSSEYIRYRDNSTWRPQKTRSTILPEMDYSSAFYYLTELSKLRSTNKYIIYTAYGIISQEIENFLNNQLNNFIWIPKTEDEDKKLEDKKLIEYGVSQLLSEFQICINEETDKIEIVQTLSRSPVNLNIENPNVKLYVKPHFPLTKDSALKDAIDEFSFLINQPNIPEDKIHKFLESHPKFLLGSRYKTLRSKVQLKREDKKPLIPDFILEPILPHDLWKIVELKVPDVRIIKTPKNRAGFNMEILNAVNQVKEYRNYFNNPVYRQRLKDIGIMAYKPSLSVIIGLDYRNLSNEEVIDTKELFAPYGLEVMTFNDLLELAKKLDSLY